MSGPPMSREAVEAAARRERRLSEWERARRYAVPRWMIEQATEARLAGDWRGACAAARIDVEIDPDRITPEIEDDLWHLAPDLLRWHLPRNAMGAGAAHLRALVLGEYDGAWLYVATPLVDHAPQRLRLRLAEQVPEHYGPLRKPITKENWSRLRHLWDARRSGDLLARHGNGERLPFFHPDGAPLTRNELPREDPGPDDPAALAEWALLLRERGQEHMAAAAAGLAGTTGVGAILGASRWHTVLLADPVMLVREARSLAVDERVTQLRIDPKVTTCLAVDQGAIRTVTLSTKDRDFQCSPVLTEACWRSSDLDLLRTGRITPEDLHPLVRDALFPERAPAVGPVGPSGPPPHPPFHVRCQDQWHEVARRDGRLVLPHPEDEVHRERALRALGGGGSGCFALALSWAGGQRELPPEPDARREALRECVKHGDAPGLLRLLDAGLDPRIRDEDGRTLLHLVHMTDHETVLPRLLAEGLDLEARDRLGATPLFYAARWFASTACVRALLEAGARTDVVDNTGWSLRDMINNYRFSELYFLRDLVAARHPGFCRGLRDAPETDA